MAYRWGEPGQFSSWGGEPDDGDRQVDGRGDDASHDATEARRSRRSTLRARDVRPELRLIIGALDLGADDPLS